MIVRDVMTRGVECIGPEAPLREAAEKMKEFDIGPLPVSDSGRLVGMVTDRDITVRATAKGLPPGLAQVKDVMTPDIIYCFDDQDLSDAAEIMEVSQVRRLVVLDGDRRLVGIVSLADLAVKGNNDALTGETLEQVSEPAMPRR